MTNISQIRGITGKKRGSEMADRVNPLPDVGPAVQANELSAPALHVVLEENQRLKDEIKRLKLELEEKDKQRATDARRVSQ